ncbi:MAG: hypothetical protein DMF84_29940 [Acidobacteria bacterium]|nr:MAG: hypothetical protein DMF84_29940 [Acidobacteriota bacterium]
MLRVSAGAAQADWESALRDLRARGAAVNVQIVGVPDPPDPLLRLDMRQFTFDVRDEANTRGAAEIDDLLFRLKRAVAVVAGGQPPPAVEIVTPPALANALQSLRDIGFGIGIRAMESTPTAHGLPDLLFGPPDGFWRLPADPLVANQLVSDLLRVLPWLPAQMLPRGTMACGNITVPLYADLAAMKVVGVSEKCPAGAAVTPAVSGATVERLDVAGVSLFRMTSPPHETLIESVGVTAPAKLTAEEIVGRHQAQAAKQATQISTLISTGSLTLTFEAPGFVAPLTITSRTTIFTGDGRTDLQQQGIRVNGVAFTANGGVPRLPIIEPERAAAPPLAITLNDLYRYRLDGRDTIVGHACYVIRFTPRDRRASLYEGRAWIAVDSFAMVRVSAVQTGLRGPITASEQTDEFRDNGQGMWLLARSDVRQTYEGAGVRTPIHRLMILEHHDVNSPEFQARRAVAYASKDVMLRDTAEGFRYLTMKAGSQKPEAGSRKPEAGSPKPESGIPTSDASRVVAGRADRVRTLAFGVIVDPNISQPLPFAGVSYVDFNLFGTGTQFNGFFGGAFGQLAFSAPSLAGSRWQLAGRAFGIATAYNDRAFEQGREQYAQDIRQRPAQASVWALRPLSSRLTLRLGYDWDYTKFSRGDVTDALFVVPANQVVHGARVGLDLQHAGWQMSMWWNPARRAGWRSWGYDAADADVHKDFQRYGLSALRSVALSPRLVTRIEAAWMAGHDLDRFSRYAFGTFDNRLHGYPSALVRYDRGGVLRTTAAWSVAKAIRLDGFADTAQVHDPGFGTRARNFTGFGAAVEAPAPFGTLLAVEWGFGVQGIDADGRRGTHVLRISGYKVF